MGEFPERPRFGEMAVRNKFITQPRLDECLAEQKKRAEAGEQKLLGDIFVEKGYLTEEQREAVLEMQKKEGNIVSGFEIIEKLAEGGMGAVYRARQISLDRVVALKILPERLAKNEEYIKRFYREAKIAASLDHVNVVRALDVGEAEGRHYFAMEFVEGESLGEILDREGKIPEERALHFVTQIGRALEHAWEHELVHRDVKPDNILVTKTDIAKLADLGLARSTSADSGRLTQTGVAMGTPHYISPEQAKGESDIDVRTDIYSLGATLYHAVCGKTPYGGSTAAVIITQHLTKPPPDPKLDAPGLSDATSFIIRKMMAKDKENRYKNPTEMLRELEKAADRQKVAPPSEAALAPSMTLMDVDALQAAREDLTARATSVQTAMGAPTSSAKWVAAAIVVVLLIAGTAVAVFFMLRGPSKELLAEAEAEYTAINGLIDDDKFDDAVQRAMVAEKKYVETWLASKFSSQVTEARGKKRKLEEDTRNAEAEYRRCEELLKSGDYSGAARDVAAAAVRFAHVPGQEERFREIRGRIAKAKQEHEAKAARVAMAKRALKSVEGLAFAGNYVEALEKSEEGAKEFSDLPEQRDAFVALAGNCKTRIERGYTDEMNRAEGAIASGGYADAERALRKALEWRPGDAPARAELTRLGGEKDLTQGLDQLRLGRHEAAVAAFEQSIPVLERALAAGSGGAAASLGKARKALEAAEQIIRCNKLVGQAGDLERQKDYTAALEIYKAALPLASRSDSMTKTIREGIVRVTRESRYAAALSDARTAARNGMWVEVRAHAIKALEVKPQGAEASLLLSQAESRLQDELRMEGIESELAAIRKLLQEGRSEDVLRIAERVQERAREEGKELDPRVQKLYEAAAQAAQAGRRSLGVTEEDLRPPVREFRAPAGIVFVEVPGGRFRMGSESGDEDEKPLHWVALGGFHISKFEVTNAQYEQYDPTHKQMRSTYSKSDSNPVVQVTWQDAKRFCRWLTGKDEEGAEYRLPTEAEWEYVACGGKMGSYPWGDKPPVEAGGGPSAAPSGGPSAEGGGLVKGDDGYFRFDSGTRAQETATEEAVKGDDGYFRFGSGGSGSGRIARANIRGKEDGSPHCSETGSYKDGASPFGVMDMAGNVWEWCEDWYAGDYYWNSPKSSPEGPGKGTYRVLRGGSWNNSASTARCRNRAGLTPTKRNANTGFRVVRIPPE